MDRVGVLQKLVAVGVGGVLLVTTAAPALAKKHKHHDRSGCDPGVIISTVTALTAGTQNQDFVVAVVTRRFRSKRTRDDTAEVLKSITIVNASGSGQRLYDFLDGLGAFTSTGALHNCV